MSGAERSSLAAIPLILAIGAAMIWAGSQGGSHIGEIPTFALCGILSFAINWIVFVPSYVSQSERYFDLTGSLTYISLVAVALLSGDFDPRSLLLASMVVVWAARLGSFLFTRITRDGTDRRFDQLKPSFPRFLMTWTLQGLWVLVTLSCALAAMTTSRPVPLGAIALLGSILWGLGFSVESMADQQKRSFRAVPENHDRFIESGIWAWSRHPNYFGEILLWLGVALTAAPVLSGWQYATLISPIFVYVLLAHISGVPLLESRAKKKWGNDPAYQAYRARTPVLFPRPPRSA